jgi:beta-phosphoglucomutase-like phosphatase (HAD superfamily)
MTPALIFDCDGVLADTERFGHLPAFNQTFAELDVPLRWDAEEYGRLLSVGGGKERIRHALTAERIESAGLPTDEDELAGLIADWHAHKTQVFRRMVADGKLPPRSGVKRLAEEALEAEWDVAVASTSALSSVESVVRSSLGENLAKRIPVFAGDLVAEKKPAPDIYLAAMTAIGCGPGEGVAVEDSRNGLLAAVRAGLPCVVTRTAYTLEEPMDEASIVVSELGEPGATPPVVEANRTGVEISGPLGLGAVLGCLLPEDDGRVASARARSDEGSAG